MDRVLTRELTPEKPCFDCKWFVCQTYERQLDNFICLLVFRDTIHYDPRYISCQGAMFEAISDEEKIDRARAFKRAIGR